MTDDELRMRRMTDEASRVAHPLDIEWEVLDRYFSGEAVSGDEAIVSRFVARPGGAQLLQSLREIWDAAGVIPARSSPDVDAGWRSMTDRIAHDDAGITSPRAVNSAVTGRRTPVSLVRWHPARIWPGVLAAVAAVAIVAISLDRIIESREAAKRASQPPPAAREYATKRAQRADVYLNDGTRVLLNVDSKLRVPANYGRGVRDVVLEGEGYFDVVHDSTRPFRVSTAAGVAEDRGTVFVVKHYPESNGMSVGVASGVVLVRRDSAALPAATLLSGDVARMDRAGKITLRHSVNLDGEVAWTAGKLVFDHVPIGEVLPRLVRWFDAEIRLGDSTLKDVRYTATFRNEPIEEVLDLLAASLDAHVRREAGSTYVLYAGNGTR